MYFLPSPSRQLAINNMERHATQTNDGSAKTIVVHCTTTFAHAVGVRNLCAVASPYEMASAEISSQKKSRPTRRREAAEEEE